MAELKTRITDASVDAFLDAVENADRRDELGGFRTGKSSLYIRSLAKVDQKILTRILRKSVARLRKQWPTT